MKRLIALALIPCLALTPNVQSDDYGFPNHFVLDSASSENCPQPVPVQVQCEAPMVVAPRLRTVRRMVPRTTYQTVTKTIMVPATTMETRQAQSVEYRDEARTRSVTVYDQVPATRQVTTEQTVLVPATRNRTETFTVQVPVVSSVPQAITVQALHTERRTGTRQITRDVPATELRIVTVGGELVRKGVTSDKGGVKVSSALVGGCTKQVEVPVMKRQVVEQTIEYDVQVARPVTTTRMVQQTEYREEVRTRTVPEAVQVQQVQTRTHNVTEMKSVPRQQTESFTERVPHVVTREVQVPVRTMVARAITEQVPVTTYDVIEEVVCD